MWALSLVVLCAFTLYALMGVPFGVLWHFVSLVTLAYVFPVGIPSLRGSAFATYVGRRLIRVNFDAASLALLSALDVTAQYVFAFEPHGVIALALIFLAVAPGADSMPAALHRNCVVVAHWALAFVPFVAQLAVLYGVRFSFPKYMLYGAIDDGCHVAVCPSGIEGKYAAAMRSADDNRRRSADGRDIVHVRRRNSRTARRSFLEWTRTTSNSVILRLTGVRDFFAVPTHSAHNQGGLGFLALATRYRLRIVPVLSLHEDAAYDNHLQWTCVYLFVVSLGRFLLLPRCEQMVVRVGRPIETTAYNADNPADMDALAEHYYAALAELGASTHVVEVK